MVDVEALKAQFLDLEFDTRGFELDADKLVAVARASGETRPEYLDASRSDFRARPAYLASLAAGRHLPLDFPDVGGIPMDGGKAVTCLAPVQPCVLGGVVTDIDEQTGSVQLDLTVKNPAGEARIFGTADVRLPTT